MRAATYSENNLNYHRHNNTQRNYNYRNVSYKRNNKRNTFFGNKSVFLTLSTLILVVSLLLTVGFVSNAKEEKTMYKYYDSYMIEKGDTLSSIAYELSSDYCSEKQIQECIDEMMSINSLDYKGTICSGNYIIVSYYSEEYK